QVSENEGTHELYLEDKLLNVVNPISKQAYSFEFVPDQPERFVLHFAPVGINDQQEFENLQVFSSGKILYVKGQSNESDYELFIHDVMGRQIMMTKDVSPEIELPHDFRTGIYMVTISSRNYITTHKLLLK
ncbi:MAG: T9SS type A sorting domain-containing protein, partial [Bacteroidales bacterium]|nr:T9SS type A sorting domain-containing protein [Bacteroidales bacterium]MCF8404898.1 T9SS type A sorting domain-containing protein [Bacteroidales bacterium]